MSEDTQKIEDTNLEDSTSTKETDLHNDNSNANDETLGDPGKKALDAERRARKEAEGKASKLEKDIATMSKKLQAIDDEKAAEQGKWEQLANERATRIEELEQEIADRDLTKQKEDAISKFKFTEEELALVNGATLEEYEASAKALAKLLKKNASPDVSGGSTSPSKAGGTEESPSKLKTWKFK